MVRSKKAQVKMSRVFLFNQKKIRYLKYQVKNFLKKNKLSKDKRKKFRLTSKRNSQNQCTRINKISINLQEKNRCLSNKKK